MDESEMMDEANLSASSADDSSASQPELMITTRERRRTAGNRYSQIVAQEQADEDEEDDVALLFAEAEGEDEEYNSDEADDEADMSSSDDDDQGPNAAPDDMEGEGELQRQAKAERQKKRKADLALTTMSALRKKPKLDPTSLHRAPDKPKPSKRKERVSWMPDQDAVPGRTSLRKQTVAHREEMLERLKESEEQRLKYKALREEKERQKQAEAPKELTQADRLAEAERIEKKNAKSLNRWETMEKRRAEEQAAKLAALKERKLEGAVVTFYSSAYSYRGPKVEHLSPAPSGIDDTLVKKRGPKPKVLKASIGTPSTAGPGAFVPSPFTNIAAANAGPPNDSTPVNPSPVVHRDPESQTNNDGWLAGTPEFASMPLSSGYQPPQEAQAESLTVVGSTEQKGEPYSWQESAPRASVISAQPSENNKKEDVDPTASNFVLVGRPSNEAVQQTLDTSRPPTPNPVLLPMMNLPPQTNAHALTSQLPELQLQNPSATAMTPASAPQSWEQPTIQAPPMIEVTSTRNLVILDRFEDLAADAMQAYSFFYNNKKTTKTAKPAKQLTELCAITGLPVKYRDPVSGLGYANVGAFKRLREVQKHAFQWSSMLGCYVGRTDQVARGVPEGFLRTDS